MLSMRNLTFVSTFVASTFVASTFVASTFAVVFLIGAGEASAQHYHAGHAPVYASGYPQQSHYNRVIVTHDAVPGHYRRAHPRAHPPAYPYVRHSAAPLPYQPVPGYRYRRTQGYAGQGAVPARRTVHRSAYGARGKVRNMRAAPKQAVAPQRRASKASGKAGGKAGNKAGRVIRAEAEVRIIGNDQMTIRLFRKRPQTR
jgi:hypothetical protein